MMSFYYILFVFYFYFISCGLSHLRGSFTWILYLRSALSELLGGGGGFSAGLFRVSSKHHTREVSRYRDFEGGPSRNHKWNFLKALLLLHLQEKKNHHHHTHRRYVPPPVLFLVGRRAGWRQWILWPDMVSAGAAEVRPAEAAKVREVSRCPQQEPLYYRSLGPTRFSWRSASRPRWSCGLKLISRKGQSEQRGPSLPKTTPPARGVPVSQDVTHAAAPVIGQRLW